MGAKKLATEKKFLKSLLANVKPLKSVEYFDFEKYWAFKKPFVFVIFYFFASRIIFFMRLWECICCKTRSCIERQVVSWHFNDNLSTLKREKIKKKTFKVFYVKGLETHKRKHKNCSREKFYFYFIYFLFSR